MMYETVDLQNVVITHYQHLSESYQKNLLLLLFIYQELYDSSKPEYWVCIISVEARSATFLSKGFPYSKSTQDYTD